MGAFGKPAERPTARQGLSARYVGAQRDPSADRTERLAAPVRTRVAREEERLAVLHLLLCHRDVEPLLRSDQMVVAVVPDVDLYPLDHAGESVVGGPVVR